MTTPDTWQAEHQRRCLLFTNAAAEPDCPWEDWRRLWSAAEAVKAAALGLTPREPSRDAWRGRNSPSCTMRGKSALRHTLGKPGEREKTDE